VKRASANIVVGYNKITNIPVFDVVDAKEAGKKRLEIG
jgi:hypothetical protein